MSELQNHKLVSRQDFPYTRGVSRNNLSIPLLSLFLGTWLLCACAPAPAQEDMQPTQATGSIYADVLSVGVRGEPGAYQFAVEISSPDSGCERYADWWEVLTADGQLVYRRILLHSHVDEQPFTRSGGPVAVDPDTELWVRAHMNQSGYGGAVQRGTPRDGFAPVEPPGELSPELERVPPQPEDCAF